MTTETEILVSTLFYSSSPPHISNSSNNNNISFKALLCRWSNLPLSLSLSLSNLSDVHRLKHTHSCFVSNSYTSYLPTYTPTLKYSHKILYVSILQVHTHIGLQKLTFNILRAIASKEMSLRKISATS